MGRYWANIKSIELSDAKNSKSYGITNEPGLDLKAEDRKSAMEEAKILVTEKNELERKKGSNKRFIYYQLIESIKDMHLEGIPGWIDKKSFEEVWTNEEYPK